MIVTACDPAVQVARVIQRDHLSEHEARLRVDAQMPIEEKVKRADDVIRTDGPVEVTNARVEEVYRSLLAGW